MSQSPEVPPQKNSLKQLLNVWDATAIVVGCIIGTGVFRAPSSISRYVPEPGLALSMWILGGLISLAGGLCYAELAAAFPKTGGDYVFFHRAYGPLGSFLFGWTKIFVERTGTIAIVGYIFAEYALATLGLDAGFGKPLALAAILGLTTANALGLSLGKNIQNLFTFLKLAALALIIGCGVYFMKDKPPVQSFSFPTTWSWGLLPSLSMALTFIFFAYGGWGESAYVAEEVKNPKRDLPRSIVLGILGVSLLYFSVNFVYHYYLTPEAMQADRFVASSMMSAAWGKNAGRVVSGMVMISAFGALNGFILTGGRILYAMAKDHRLFSPLTRVHPIHQTPTWSLWVNGAIAMGLVVIGTFDDLVTYTTVVITIFNAMAVGSVMIIRRKYPDVERPYKAWGYPVTPILFISVCLIYIVSASWREPKVALLGVAISSLGWPLYLLSRRIK